MAISLVGQGSAAGLSQTGPLTITYSGTSGNLLAVVAHLYNNANASVTSMLPTSVTDSTAGSNTWHVSTTDTSGTTNVPPSANSNAYIGSHCMTNFIAYSFLSASVTSVTSNVTNQASTLFWRYTVAEFSGVSAFDNSWAGTVSNPAALQTSFTSGTVTINSAGSLVLGSVDWDASSGTPTCQSGMTAFTAASNGNLAYTINPATGSFSQSNTATVAGGWAGGMAVFTPAGTNAPAGNAPSTGVPPAPASSLRIGMTIRGS